MLLVLISVLGVAAAGVVSVGHAVSRRHAEQALLVVGEEFRAALGSYTAVAGSGFSAGPQELQDLLRDPRFPGVVRHLRQIRCDPLTGQPTWGVLRDAGGRITAVYSLAEGVPIKRAGFEPMQQGFENASTYADWHFTVAPLTSPRRSMLGLPQR